MSGVDYHLAKPTRDFQYLAPAFRDAVQSAMAECDVLMNPKPTIFETYRSEALQAVYFARGRTIRPPDQPVTNARSNLYSWHGYGLAVDVVCCKEPQWGQPLKWFEEMAVIFKKYGCKWGGNWTTRDLPHFQWGLCKPSPSDTARYLLRTEGIEGVWRAVGAMGTG